MLTFTMTGYWTAYTFCAGQKYYYNKKTQVSQWENPHAEQKIAPVHASGGTSRNVKDDIWMEQPSMLEKCLNCGGWGVGLVQAWGYCNHCTRYVIHLCEQWSCLD